MPQRVMLRFSVETFLSHSTETFCRRTLLCCVSENFCWRKSLWKRRGEGGLSKLSVEKFFSQIAEKFQRGIFYSVNNFGYRKNLCFRGLCYDLPSKVFCLTVTKQFVEEPFCAVFQKTSGGEKVYGKEVGRGSIETFRRKFFVSKCRKISKGNLLVCL